MVATSIAEDLRALLSPTSSRCLQVVPAQDAFRSCATNCVCRSLGGRIESKSEAFQLKRLNLVSINEESAMKLHAGWCFFLGVHIVSTAWPYKVVDVPIHLVNSSNETVNELDEIMLENSKHDVEELREIPDPTNQTGQDNETTGFGGLAKQLEFMMLKMVQLETLCDMQQYEIEMLRLKVKEHDKILAKGHKSLIQLPERDPETHLKKAQETMERVAVKHSKQLTTRDFHPSHSAPQAE